MLLRALPIRNEFKQWGRGQNQPVNTIEEGIIPRSGIVQMRK